MADIEQQFDTIAEEFATRPKTKRGQMFGKPSLSVNGNAFAAFHRESMAFKLPETERAEALALKGAVLWDPSGKGRPMKEWAAIPAAHASRWNEFAEIAHEHVGKLPAKK